MTPKQLTGREFEEHLLKAMEFPERADEATMGRYGVQGAFFKKPNETKPTWTPRQSLPDFEGVLGNGRQFIVEAKSCSQSSFKLDDDHFKKRQLSHLLLRSKFDVITMLVIHWNERELKTRTDPAVTFAFPVKHEHKFWGLVEAGSVISLRQGDCDQYAVEIEWKVPSKRTRTARPDLLSAILELAELEFQQYKELEICVQCGGPAGRAGHDDDSLFVGKLGPLCDVCQKWVEVIVETSGLHSTASNDATSIDDCCDVACREVLEEVLEEFRLSFTGSRKNTSADSNPEPAAKQ